MTSTPSLTDTIRLRSRLSPESVTARHRLDGARSSSMPGKAAACQVIGRAVLADREQGTHATDEVHVILDEPTRWSQLVVRTFDLGVAVIGLVVLAPLVALVAIAVKVESRGPILYSSSRLGHTKPLFRIWKFRSMRPDADTVLDHLLATDDDARQEYEHYVKLRQDPRLTRLGSFIRRTSIDELPQLFNILIGEMSVVGPRPKAPVDAEVFGPALEVVLQVKPGLTGLWQVSGRNQVPIQDRVALDVEYALTRTMTGDLLICAKTFVQLWRPARNGAY